MFSIFKGLVGSKALTAEDLEPVISKLRDNLIDKNVASEVANSLCDSVTMKLEGSVTGTFQSVQNSVKVSLCFFVGFAFLFFYTFFSFVSSSFYLSICLTLFFCSSSSLFLSLTFFSFTLPFSVHTGILFAGDLDGGPAEVVDSEAPN